MRTSSIKCQRCDKSIRTYSPMRKWCVECRRIISLERAKSRKTIILRK